MINLNDFIHMMWSEKVLRDSQRSSFAFFLIIVHKICRKYISTSVFNGSCQTKLLFIFELESDERICASLQNNLVANSECVQIKGVLNYMSDKDSVVWEKRKVLINFEHMLCHKTLKNVLYNTQSEIVRSRESLI